ncbi:hypothetical protein ACNKHL_00355 [Shigella flexneri]
MTRVMPEFKVDGKMVFERDMEMLAPGLYPSVNRAPVFVRAVSRSESDIYNYDYLCCNLLLWPVPGPDLRRSYCIASANQVMTGVTSRIIRLCCR